MNPIFRAELDAKRSALVALCKKYGVASVDVFGSATGADWQPDKSDIDFFVAFHPIPGQGLADRYLGLAEELEALFGRSVDLLTSGSIRNPYFRRNVDATRAPIYAE